MRHKTHKASEKIKNGYKK